MSRMKFQLNVVSFTLMLVLLSVLGYQSFAQRSMGTQSTNIAVIDLGSVLEGLAQRSDAAIALDEMESRIRAEQERRLSTLEELRNQLLDMGGRVNANEVSLEQAHSLEEEFVLGRLNFEAWLQFSRNQMDVEASLQLQELYRAIRRAVRELASEQGYELVLIDDSKGELMVNPESSRSREEQVLQQMRTRTMLHASSSIDITTELIERMNNQYRAGQAER